MANTELNSDDVSAALLLVDNAEKALTAAFAAKGYEGIVWRHGAGFYVTNTTPPVCEFMGSFDGMAALIESLPHVWTASLCEQTLGVREAA